MAHEITQTLMVRPGESAAIESRATDDRFGLAEKAQGSAELEGLITQLSELQNRLWAEAQSSTLLVLQGLDTSGKDGTIRKVFTGVNPQGCRVQSFKVPTATDLAHDYLWRVHAGCPRRGEIGIFNRSHYEDVVALPVVQAIGPDQLARRYRHINDFEQMLADEGTTIVKCYLHISSDEQRRRLQQRLDDPAKRWKLLPSDLETRAHWDANLEAYEAALTATSTATAPWYIVPADRKWVRDVVVAALLVEALTAMNPQVPPPDPRLDHITVF
jgi:PPK2 family polyphosphate:nucleotide phosphotransferase